MKIRAIFKKHFNAAGEGDDFPTDSFRPSHDALADMTFVEMRPPSAEAECDEDGGAYGEEEWIYSLDAEYFANVEHALEAASDLKSYEVLYPQDLDDFASIPEVEKVENEGRVLRARITDAVYECDDVDADSLIHRLRDLSGASYIWQDDYEPQADGTATVTLRRA